jgi:hypothetical protein
MPIIKYISKGLMGEYDYNQPEKKKEFHWLTIDALFFWIIEIYELCKWCGKSILGVFRRKKIEKNSDKEGVQGNDI